MAYHFLTVLANQSISPDLATSQILRSGQSLQHIATALLILLID